jgi:hypothetical protein
MAKHNQKHLRWLRTLSTGEAWKQIVKDATIGTNVDADKFLQKLSPLPNFKIARTFVGGSAGCL